VDVRHKKGRVRNELVKGNREILSHLTATIKGREKPSLREKVRTWRGVRAQVSPGLLERKKIRGVLGGRPQRLGGRDVSKTDDAGPWRG